MKRTVRALALLLLVSLLPLWVVGCTETPAETLPTLPAPTGLAVSEEGLVTWEAVPGATMYGVTVGEMTYTVSGTSYRITNTTADYRISVIAAGSGYLDSPRSEEVVYLGSLRPVIPPGPAEVTVSIVCADSVESGHTMTVKAKVAGAEDQTVMWTLTAGQDLAEIDTEGRLTVRSGCEGGTVTVRATSLYNEACWAEKTVEVETPPALTQAMLDELATQTKLGFEGYLRINLYKNDITEAFYSTYNTDVKTALDGSSWYAEYDSTGTGVMTGLYYRNRDGRACQVGVSFMNEEQYADMLDGEGNPVSWEDAGLYNNFPGLSVADFAFSEETWRYEYVGHDETLMARMVASANPYDFVPVSFGLIVEDGAVLGIYAKSAKDYGLADGYYGIQELICAVNIGETVEVKTISKYSHEEIHDVLQGALDFLHEETQNYTMDLRMITVSSLGAGTVEEGFVESVTESECFFDPYLVSYVTLDGVASEKKTHTGEYYGYHKVNEGLYNSYFAEDGKMVANRAFAADFETAKPSFAFAPEIFRSFYEDEETGAVTFYTDDIMCQVASTFYMGVGNDIQLYGLYATEGWTSATESFTPYVTVEDGRITEAGFYFYLGYLYGVVEITLSGYNETEVPAQADFTGYEVRQVPTAWDELTIIVSGESGTDDDTEVNAKDYLDDFAGDAAAVPFFGDVIGDTFGFALTTIHLPVGGNIARPAVVFYYDVPLDSDGTLTSSLSRLAEQLRGAGFAENGAGEFSREGLWIQPVDSSLDLMIYVWKQ